MRNFNFMKQLRYLLFAVLVLAAVVPAFGFTSSPKFKAEKTSDSPSGGGKIYAYRGGGDGRSPYDKIDLTISENDWKNPDSEVTLISDITLKQGENEPDGYKVMDRTSNDATGSTYILHMYYFAKPNTGYEFVGWYSNAAGTSKINGSTDHYPLPEVSGTNKDVNKYYYTSKVSQPNDQQKKTYTAVQWNNGEKGKTPNPYGPWEDSNGNTYYYLRDAFEITSANANDGAKIYVKFRVKPRDFELGGTGFDDVSYTATGYAGSVGKTSVTANNISADIALSLTYDSEKYTFNGWFWAEGGFTNGTSISTDASTTYTMVAARGLTAGTKVHIWPDIKRKINPVAEVDYNDGSTPEPFESWAEAIAAAKATGVSGATITLFQDVADITEAQEIDRDMTLDLNGHTFSGTANYLFTVKGSGTDFTITNGSVSEGIISFSTDAVTPSYAVGVQTGAKLILEGGKIYANNTKSDGTGRGVEIQSGGTLEMTGGTVESQALQNAYAIINRGTATISGTADLYAHTASAATAVAFYNVGTSATINGGTFRAYAATTTAYGIQQNVANTLTITDATVRAEAVTSTAYALARSNGTIVVNSGKYNAVAPSTVAAVNVTNNEQITLKGGIYRTNTSVGSCCHSDYGCYELTRGETWNEGYRYEVLPKSQARNFRVIADGVSNYFTSFADLNTFINASSSPVIQIFLIVPEYTVPAGNYTIPSVAALVIPYDFDCTIKTDDPEHPYTSPTAPSVYRKLILANGANITVNSGGYISVGGTSQGGQPYGGAVHGKYGQIDMKSGSSITLKTGTNLYCWGYITGQGDITAESGSTVYEDFQIACWRGGTAASNMNKNSKKVFPLAQYYIQNIEAKLHLQSGATEKVWTAVSALSDTQRPNNPLPLVGQSSGLFQISSGELTKWYDPENDRQMYQVDGNMALGSISMTVYVTISSTDYVLPLTNNMDITINSGTMTCNNDIALLPGANIKIGSGATASLGSNCRLYVYDRDEWGVFNYYTSVHKGAGYLCEANYSPTCSGIHGKRLYSNMEDAKIDVNGTLSVSKAIYTTSSGANICSSEGTGRVELHADAGTETETYQATQSGSDISYTSIPITSAKLLNANGTFTPTAGAKSGDYFQYCDGTWMKGGCVTYYTITWKSEDGNSTLYTDEVADGLATSFDGTAPEKAATAEYTYTFDGWATEANGAKVYEPNGTPVATGNVTYYAHFSQTPQSYTLTWSTDGDDLTGNYTSGSTNYGATIIAPDTPTKVGYIFAGWHNGSSIVTPSTMPAANTTYTAQWTPAVASVTAGGTTYYATLPAAFIAAKGKTNPTIKLLQDVEVSDNLTYDGANTCTLDLNGHNISRSGGTRLLIIDNESAIFTITDNSESKLGTLSLSTSSTSEAPFCVYVNNGNLQLEAGTIYTNSSAKNAGGVRTQTSGSSTFTMNGGTVHVETGTDFTGYGVQTLGTATINNGTVLVEAGAIGYALWVQNSGATVTIENGKFNVTGANAYASNAIAPNDALQLKGGYYSTNTMDNSATIDSKYVATNYHVFNTTAAEKAEIGSAYEYKVAEAYNVTFKDGDNNTIQSGLVEKNATPVYSGETPTKSQTAEYTYSFKGSWSPEISPVTAEATYTAQFNSTPRSYSLTWNLNGGNVQTAGTTAGSVAYGTSLSAPVVIKDGYSFASWSPEVPSTMPAADAEYTATWTINEYSITFNSNGGSEVDPITQNYGTDVTAPADPTREGYTFKCWIPEVPSTMPLNGTTCVAQWEINSTLDIKENKIVTVSETATVVTTIVHEGGELEVASDKTLKTDVLIVEASATNSGQITGAGNVEVKASTGKAYFDLKLNTPARHWHAFGVPWAVDITANPLVEVDGDGNVVRTLTLGSHYEIVYYDTHTRATQGPSANCWKYLKHYDQDGQPVEIMQPGQGYMIAFTCSVQTVRFVKKEGAPVIFDGEVTVSAEGEGTNQGINALANPMAYYATLNAGPTVGYVHDGGEIGSDGYEEFDIDNKSFIVGRTVYIQVQSTEPVVTVEVEQSDAEQISKILAPARRKVVTDKEYLSLGDYYHVSISSATINGGSVYVLPEEDKEDKYVIGHDLVKMGMSTKKPQIWVNRYGVNLGLNTIAPINETAEFPINLYTPSAGDYTITNNQSPMTNDEYIVYLTQNGEAIWNLSDAPYAISLPAGVNKTYGLRLTARKSPTIATGVDEAVVDAKNEIRKVLIDDKVFIIREGNVYSIDGQLVK